MNIQSMFGKALETVLNAVLATVHGFVGLLDGISARLVPAVVRRQLTPLKAQYPLPYNIVKTGIWTSIFGAAGLFVFFCTVYAGFFGHIPSDVELKNIERGIASEVLSEDGQLLGKYFTENRTQVSYTDINKNIINALVATEDKRFFEHEGIDFLSYGRVIIKSILFRHESSGGGSTISQQLAKNLFPRRRYGWRGLLTMPVSKTKEMILASRLEGMYNKQEVLTLYLNTVSFGEDTYGIGTASLLFFNRKASEVTTDEAAVLVGTLKAPSTYNPRIHSDRALLRRNTVLQLMTTNGYITETERHSLSAKPLGVQYNAAARNEGPAPHFLQKIRPEIEAALAGLQKEDGTPYDLNSDGLRVYTTIDSRMQQYATDATHEHLAKLQEAFDKQYAKTKPWGKGNDILTAEFHRSHRYKEMDDDGATEAEIREAFNVPTKMKVFTYKGEEERTMTPWDSLNYYHGFLSAALLALDPKTGHVKAWVGGPEFKINQFDHVTARRQVGSTFKPIVYTAALAAGQQPCDYIPNEQKTYPEYENWRPDNADGKYGGAYSMKGGLTNSVNTIAVALLFKAGIDNVVALAQRMGITSPIPNKPSIALGSADVTLKEMVTVYSTIASYGTRRDPVYILKIEDRKGRVLKTFSEPTSQTALPDSLAAITIEMMRGVIDNGTGARLRSTFGFRNDIAGKTGTTQAQTDGWFIGFTPNLVAGVWVGGDDPAVRFRSLALGQGANTSLPIWGSFFKQVYANPALAALGYGSSAKFRPRDSIGGGTSMNCPDFEAGAAPAVEVGGNTPLPSPVGGVGTVGGKSPLPLPSGGGGAVIPPPVVPARGVPSRYPPSSPLPVPSGGLKIPAQKPSPSVLPTPGH